MTAQTAARAAEQIEDLDADSLADMFLSFDLGEEEYAVSIAGVIEIVGIQRIMPVPDMPAYVKGVINLRGKVIPLMDVRLRFGMPERAYDDRTVIIVMEVNDAPVGLIVDGVREVLEIPPAQIDRQAHFARSGGKSVIAGIGRVEDRVAVLLDPAVLVSDGDLAIARERAEA